MNYVKIYRQLILKRRLFPLYKDKTQPGWVHYHHVFPVACGGSNDKPKDVNKKGSNLIGLTRKEHFIAHHLLKKICETSKNMSFRQSMNYAYRLMSGLVHDGKWVEIRITAKVYANACADAALNKNRKLSESHKAKIRAALRTPEARERARKQSSSRRYSSLARLHMSQAQQKRRDEISKQFKGKPKTEEHRAKIKAALNKPEVKAKISIASSNRIVSEDTKLKIKIARNKPETQQKINETRSKYTDERRKEITEKRRQSRANWTDEFKNELRLRISQKLKGRKLSDEHKQKLRKKKSNTAKKNIKLASIKRELRKKIIRIFLLLLISELS